MFYLYQDKLTKKIYYSNDIYYDYLYPSFINIEGLKVVIPEYSITTNYFYIEYDKNLFNKIKLTSKLKKVERT